MNYFENCKTPEEAKICYKRLAKQLHPDMKTGNKDAFQEMEQQYRAFLSTSMTEKQKEYSNKAQFLDYLTDFFNDNPEMMQIVLKSLFKSDSLRNFIQKNSSIIDAGIGIYNLLKQN